jgi:hypothetical protein
MKRWQSVATVAGFVVALTFVAFVTERSQRPRMSWADDWRDLRPFLAAMGRSYAMFAAVFLALWGGYLLWRTLRQKSPEGRIDAPQDLFVTHWRHVVAVSVLSVVLAVAAWNVSKMQTPGWWVAGTLNNLIGKNDLSLTLWLFLMIPVIVDAGICFAILWGGFLLWMKVRQEACQ